MKPCFLSPPFLPWMFVFQKQVGTHTLSAYISFFCSSSISISRYHIKGIWCNHSQLDDNTFYFRSQILPSQTPERKLISLEFSPDPHQPRSPHCVRRLFCDAICLYWVGVSLGKGIVSVRLFEETSGCSPEIHRSFSFLQLYPDPLSVLSRLSAPGSILPLCQYTVHSTHTQTHTHTESSNFIFRYLRTFFFCFWFSFF